MSGPHDVVFSARAARDLERIPEKIAAACVEFIFGPLAGNPHRLGKPLHDDFARFHAARRGDYRVMYQINDDRHAIEIVHIDRRSDVYR